MRTINYYSYEELLAAAIAPGATQDDVDALGEWFSSFGSGYWNGECYDASAPGEQTGTRSLFEIVEWDEELDCGAVVGYELR